LGELELYEPYMLGEHKLWTRIK